RRLLRSVPAYARTLIKERRNSLTGPSQVAKSVPSPGQTPSAQLPRGHDPRGLEDGSVIIAAITSCTNTSNPTVMIGAGLIAKGAVLRGLSPKPFVKCSLAPGSIVVKDYLEGSGLLTYLDQLGFNLVGYGCTTCIAQGTPILLGDGTTRSIENLPARGGALVFGPDGRRRLRIAQQSNLLSNGIRDCVELVLQD